MLLLPCNQTLEGEKFRALYGLVIISYYIR